jgi:hypothetical protein
VIGRADLARLVEIVGVVERVGVFEHMEAVGSVDGGRLAGAIAARRRRREPVPQQRQIELQRLEGLGADPLVVVMGGRGLLPAPVQPEHLHRPADRMDQPGPGQPSS